jgi:Zn finger protein HypA/HybF involved in hydrogenase expression
MTHFIKADDRACVDRTGETRRVTTDPNAVTCPKCQSKDRLVLTEQGRQTLAQLGYR